MNGYTLGRLQGQTKWLTDAPIRLPLEFCIFTKRLFYKKNTFLSQAIAPLRRSVGLTVWNNQTGHTPPNYCNACTPRVNKSIIALTLVYSPLETSECCINCPWSHTIILFNCFYLLTRTVFRLVVYIATCTV